ncbi:MAG: hypothetical protein QGH60_13855 [Phycisphaerae bacterium]|jgi:hypothetical protein|nr:hypothetical protein [Phycisphaerae bacterium]
MAIKLRPKDRHKAIVQAVQEDNLTAKETAERFGLTLAGIYYICRKHNIKPRKRRKDYLPSKYPKIADKDWLREKFVDQYLTYQSIADMVGCSRQRVHQRVIEFGLTRPRISRAKPKKPKRVIPLKGLLKDKRIRGIYKGKRFIAHVMPSGAIKRRDTGEVFDSPCDAARSISGRKRVDGWNFWKYRVSKGCWEELAELKEA